MCCVFTVSDPTHSQCYQRQSKACHWILIGLVLQYQHWIDVTGLDHRDCNGGKRRGERRERGGGRWGRDKKGEMGEGEEGRGQ